MDWTRKVKPVKGLTFVIIIEPLLAINEVVLICDLLFGTLLKLLPLFQNSCDICLSNYIKIFLAVKFWSYSSNSSHNSKSTIAEAVAIFLCTVSLSLHRLFNLSNSNKNLVCKKCLHKNTRIWKNIFKKIMPE